MRRDELYVADLVDNTRAIREYLDGISREQWDQDRARREAVVYRLLLLGETASALPDILRDRSRSQRPAWGGQRYRTPGNEPRWTMCVILVCTACAAVSLPVWIPADARQAAQIVAVLFPVKSC